MDLEIALVQSGVISAGDYVAAVKRQQCERPPLGQVAIEEGVLSVRRVLELLKAQRDTPDHRFGELAIEYGYLHQNELTELLLHQVARQRPLIVHLIELGALSKQQADNARKQHYQGSLTTITNRPESPAEPQEDLIGSFSFAEPVTV